MVHGLGRSELRHGGEDPESVGRQEHDVLRLPPHALPSGIRNMRDRIGGPGVLGELGRIQIKPPIRVEGHVFQDRAEAPGGVIDLGLSIRREPNHFCVAPTLQVEHPVIAPAMFVVTDEGPAGVRGKGGLPRPGKAEEEGCLVLRVAIIGGAVHGENALPGE